MWRLAVLLAISLIAGCTTYSVPTASNTVQLGLTREDVKIGGEASGSDWALGIFPFNWIWPAGPRSEAEALGVATKNAYEQGAADYILQPRAKTFYINLILFDYASTEIVGKTVSVKLTNDKQ
jgi:hypothetical protein